MQTLLLMNNTWKPSNLNYLLLAPALSSATKAFAKSIAAQWEMVWWRSIGKSFIIHSQTIRSIWPCFPGPLGRKWFTDLLSISAHLHAALQLEQNHKRICTQSQEADDGGALTVFFRYSHVLHNGHIPNCELAQWLCARLVLFRGINKMMSNCLRMFVLHSGFIDYSIKRVEGRKEFLLMPFLCLE